MLSVGISFAVWNYGFLGETNKIETGDIEIEFLESNTDIISIEDALPMGDNEGKAQDKTFNFQVRTKTKNDTDIGYSLILERLETLCGDLDNPNRDDYPECYNKTISDTDKAKLLEMCTNNLGDTEEDCNNWYQQIINGGVDGYGYDLDAWLNYYKDYSGETITPTYEFDNTKTYGSIEQLKDKDIKIYLEDYQGNVLLEPTKVSEISSDYVIYTKINSHDSTNENIKDKYKLRVWIDGETDTSDWNITEKHQYKFKIGVKTKLKESDVSTDENLENSDFKYTVKYNANGGKGTMENSTFVYNQTGKLSKNNFTKEHYTFKGWSTKSTSNQVVHNDEAEVKNLTDVYHGVVNLYAVWEINSYDVNVVVQNGTVDTATKSIEHGQNGIFNLTPTISGTKSIVTCTNNQTGTVSNDILTVSNVTKYTTCTIKYITEVTTLYTDGTLIINENLANRSSNITTHGAVTNEYDAMSSSNSYVMNSSYSQPWRNERYNITSIEIDNEIHPTSTANWFLSLRNVSYGDFTNLKTENVTNMSSMFREAGSSATTFNIGNLSSWNTSSVTNMSSMFSYAGQNATTFNIGDLSSWNTSSVTNMSSMFNGAGRSATTWSIGDLSSWNTSSVTNMAYMFKAAGYNATTFDISYISSWDTSSVTNMIGMFNQAGYNATTWSIGDLSSWDTSSVTDMRNMFQYAGESATTFNIGDLSSWDTSSVTNMSYMFYYAGYNATWSLNCSSWNVNNVTSHTSFNTGVTSKVTAPTWVN